MTGPLLADVRFDHAAATRAAATCRATARQLEELLRARDRARDLAHRHWRGAHARRWTEVDDRLRRDALAQVEELRRTAASIDGAADAAHREQARRDRVNAARIEAARRERLQLSGRCA